MLPVSSSSTVLFNMHDTDNDGTITLEEYRHVSHSLTSGLLQVAERLRTRVSNQKVAGSISHRAKLRCVLGQGTSPYLPRGYFPVLSVSRSG